MAKLEISPWTPKVVPLAPFERSSKGIQLSYSEYMKGNLIRGTTLEVRVLIP